MAKLFCQDSFDIASGVDGTVAEPLEAGKDYHIQVHATADLKSAFADIRLEDDEDGADTTTDAGATPGAYVNTIKQCLLDALNNCALEDVYSNSATLPTQGAAGVTASPVPTYTLPRGIADGSADGSTTDAMTQSAMNTQDLMKVSAGIAYFGAVHAGDFNVNPLNANIIAATGAAAGRADLANAFAQAVDPAVTAGTWLNKLFRDMAGENSEGVSRLSDPITTSGSTHNLRSCELKPGDDVWFLWTIDFSSNNVTMLGDSSTQAGAATGPGGVKISLRCTQQ